MYTHVDAWTYMSSKLVYLPIYISLSVCVYIYIYTHSYMKREGEIDLLVCANKAPDTQLSNMFCPPSGSPQINVGCYFFGSALAENKKCPILRTGKRIYPFNID